MNATPAANAKNPASSTTTMWKTSQPEQSNQRVVTRMVVLASADTALKQRLKQELSGMRWTVLEAGGGAEAMVAVEAQRPEALVVDSWLPDLEMSEFAAQMASMYSGMDVLRIDGRPAGGSMRSARRNELLHAIRVAEDAGVAAPVSEPEPAAAVAVQSGTTPSAPVTWSNVALPEMIGQSAPMLELARLIRLVAPKNATVLIEGETGTGKEVVAKAVHRLSSRAGKPFAVLNCAAIPEALLEAELFGHTRGAFTGAVQSRTGRIEAAHGGTLFLDEIGEMPLALQSKMLRFLECGELQRVGDNECVKVDVRVIAATHQPLVQRAEERAFRLDLYHRLAVFPLEVPALRDRMGDLPALVHFFLEQMGRDQPRKAIAADAMGLLATCDWPGNVRELMHVLERAAILADDRAEIQLQDIRLRGSNRA